MLNNTPSSRTWIYGLAVLLVVVVVGVVLWTVDDRPALFTPFDAGLGTESDPWKSSTAEQLVAIGSDDNYLSGTYVLVDDIDFDDVDDSGFIGIGGLDRPFTGNFDGGRHTIENFSVQTSNVLDVGLFRVSKGMIQSIEMVGVDIVAGDSSHVGSIVGENGGEVIDIQADGVIVGEHGVGGLVGSNLEGGRVVGGKASGDVDGERQVGGLVGSNLEGGRVVKGIASGDVKGKRIIGGLVGKNWEEGQIVEGKASGDVDGEWQVGGMVGMNLGEVAEATASGDVAGNNAGGLVGTNLGEVAEATASGDVAGDRGVGGFVGNHSSDASIVRSYSTGTVNGDVDVGGFTGRVNDPNSIEFAYWNIGASGLDTSAGGVGLTDEEFGDPDNFEGFVFCPDEECRWVMDDDERRPVLKVFQ